MRNPKHDHDDHKHHNDHGDHHDHPEDHDEHAEHINEHAAQTIFKPKSQSTCLLECKVKQAHKKCGCVPWDYPHFDLPEANRTEVCVLQGSECFENFMAGVRDDEDGDGIEGVEDEDGEHEMCDCPQDCNQVTYSYSVTSTALQEDRICHKGTEKVTRKKGSFLA